MFVRKRRANLFCAISIFAILQGCSPLKTVPIELVGTGTCREFFLALDEKISSAAVNDAQYRRVEGFPYLRIDRFSTSLKDEASRDSGSFVALINRLRGLDLEARAFELANADVEVAPNIARAQGCGVILQAHDLANPQTRKVLNDFLVVKDDYVTAFRFFGAYAITKFPFAKGVERLETQRTTVLTDLVKPEQGASEIVRRVLFPKLDATHTVDLASVLRPRESDVLRLPDPSSAQLTGLFDRFAPIFDLAIASEADLTGSLGWTTDKKSRRIAIDSSKPTVYRHSSMTRYQGHNLLQLVYTIWFSARPKEAGATIDLLAGAIDGLMFRVTLSPNGEPLVYDSIHSCGCYHTFFPVESTQVKPAPQPLIEWAYAPVKAPTLKNAERLVLKVAAGTHYIDRIEKQSGRDPSAESYQWLDYNQLRSVAIDDKARRSLFDTSGFMRGTDRLESWLFWPMGIERAGTMRQWGRHATAFVGRRHFDDAYLMEERFLFDSRHFPQNLP